MHRNLHTFSAIVLRALLLTLELLLTLYSVCKQKTLASGNELYFRRINQRQNKNTQAQSQTRKFPVTHTHARYGVFTRIACVPHSRFSLSPASLLSPPFVGYVCLSRSLVSLSPPHSAMHAPIYKHSDCSA